MRRPIVRPSLAIAATLAALALARPAWSLAGLWLTLGALLFESWRARRRPADDFQQISELSRDLICLHDTQGRYTYASPSSRKLLGYEPAELVGTSPYRSFHPDDRDRVGAEFRAVAANQSPEKTTRYRIRRRDGSYVWFESLTRPLLDARGRVQGVHIVSRDVTEAQQALEALEREQRNLRRIIASAPISIAMFDREMRYLTCSRQWLADHGITDEAVTGRSHYDYFPGFRQTRAAIYERALRGEFLSGAEDRMPRLDGTLIWVRWAIQPWQNHDGEIGGIVIVTQRIDELVEAREAALDMARVKSSFLANMSHEIRTPLNAIVGFTDLLQGTALDESQRQLVQTVQDSNQRLMGLINEVLDFSKLEAGRIQPECVAFSPVESVEAQAELLALRAHEKALSFTTFIAPDVPTGIKGDPVRTGQVLLNLISNALKFTAQGSILVRCEKWTRSPDGRPRLRFSVTDTGIGLSPDDQKKLFLPFSQVDGSTARRYGGTGLGLSICKRLVELMEGEIGIESEVGQGSCFWFVLPFTELSFEEQAGLRTANSTASLRVLIWDRDPTAARVARDYMGSWGHRRETASSLEDALERCRKAALAAMPYDVLLVGEDHPVFGQAPGHPKVIVCGPYGDASPLPPHVQARITKPIKQSALLDALLNVTLRPSSPADVTPPAGVIDSPPASPPEGRILVVEDNRVNQMLTVAQLAKLGFRASLAANGQEALAIIAREPFDLILMDCQMPIMDGFEATRQIRNHANRGLRRLPIVALTANALEGDREKCLAAGMDAYLSKPVKVEALRQTLEDWLGPQGLRRAS